MSASGVTSYAVECWPAFVHRRGNYYWKHRRSQAVEVPEVHKVRSAGFTICAGLLSSRGVTRKKTKAEQAAFERNNVLRIVRRAAFAERVARCVEAAAEVHGVPWNEIVQRSRGTPQAAKARVAAMNACLVLGVPIFTTAKAFKRTRRTVHGAVRIGRPGGEKRDAALLSSTREILRRVSDPGKKRPD